MFSKIAGSVIVIIVSIFADLHEEVRDYFEWGEYPALINTLSPIIDSLSKNSDSSHISKYHMYLGVALFSTEKTGDARTHFFKALQFDSSIALPSEYVSNEITALFKVIKSEFEKQLRLNFMEDSLAVIHRREAELFNKNRITGEFRKKHKRFVVSSISSTTVSAVLLGLSIVQYDKGRSIYRNFKHAAYIGDQTQYNTLRSQIKYSNNLILTLDITSGVTFCTGFVTALKAHQARNQLYRIESHNE